MPGASSAQRYVAVRFHAIVRSFWRRDLDFARKRRRRVAVRRRHGRGLRLIYVVDAVSSRPYIAVCRRSVCSVLRSDAGVR